MLTDAFKTTLISYKTVYFFIIPPFSIISLNKSSRSRPCFQPLCSTLNIAGLRIGRFIKRPRQEPRPQLTIYYFLFHHQFISVISYHNDIHAIRTGLKLYDSITWLTLIKKCSIDLIDTNSHIFRTATN